MSNKKTMTVKEFSEIYGIGINSAYNMVRREDFPKIKLGRKILIFKEELPAWFELHKGEDLAQ